MLDQVLAEVDKEAELFIHQPQIGQDLLRNSAVPAGVLMC
jgi:hypothetical protein